jgi:hypothetical protein
VRLALPPGDRSACTFFLEAYDLRIGASARREALGRDVGGLEQVRLADTIRADDE